MFYLGLILKNMLRHRLRSLLTLLGLVVAILSFGLLSTVVSAWYAGAEGASSARLITRNAISLVFPLPLAYKQRIKGVDGVKRIAWANWFGGIYQDPKNFFPQFAVDPESYLAAYAEYKLPEDQRAAFIKDRRACVIGRKLANTYGFKLGDVVPLKGTIYPGNWEFVVRGIYDGADATTDTSQLFFHWELLNEQVKLRYPRRANTTGVYVVEIDNPDRAAGISLAIDAQFKNSAHETLTETEKAFQLGFVAMTEAIVVAIRLVSYVVIVIILAVMANTMAMTARERLSEYATLKAIGFGPGFIAALIFGESIALALLGGAIGVALTYPVATAFGNAMGTLFPNFYVSAATVMLQLACALTVGVVAALVPAWQSARVNIVDGLRSIG